MVIDFHTHVFPDSIAARAVGGLASGADMMNYLDGTAADLRRSMDAAGIDFSVLMPVVTKPAQQESINRAAVEADRRSRETGIISFGGIHPENENYRDILKALAGGGVPGVKIHPLFQRTPIDDIRYMRIIGYASELGLIVLTHAGLDPSFPNQDLSSVRRIKAVLRETECDKLVLAHMGGLGQWESALELMGCGAYIDTACSLYPWRDMKGNPASNTGYAPLSAEMFVKMIKTHGAGRVLFGSDSPWADQSESLALIRGSGLAPCELEAVLGGNAARLLGL